MANKIFKARASSLYEIMPDPKTKTNLISDGAITHLNNWVDMVYFNRKNEVKTFAMQKGTECEIEALTIVKKYLNKPNLKKDNRHFEDEYLTGHIDIDNADDDEIIDIKICETFSTFPRFKTKLEKVYEAQMQAYMSLTGRNNAKVIKVLVNSPAWQIKSLINRIDYSLLNKYGETNEQHDAELNEAINSIFAQHVFDGNIQFDKYKLPKEMYIPIEQRVKVFEVKRDQEFIDKIPQKVLNCREFLKQNGY